MNFGKDFWSVKLKNNSIKRREHISTGCVLFFWSAWRRRQISCINQDKTITTMTTTTATATGIKEIVKIVRKSPPNADENVVIKFDHNFMNERLLRNKNEPEHWLCALLSAVQPLIRDFPSCCSIIGNNYGRILLSHGLCWLFCVCLFHFFFIFKLNRDHTKRDEMKRNHSVGIEWTKWLPLSNSSRKRI